MSATSGRPPAVIVGLDNFTGLQSSRILARRGIDVIGIARDGGHPATRTNTCRRVIVSPLEGDRLLETLATVAETDPGAVLVPCTDGAVVTISAGRDRLGPLRTVLPDHEVVLTLLRKDRFAEHAATHDLPVPRGHVVATPADARRAAEELTFPCVVKPAVKNAAWEAAQPKVRSFEDAEAWLAEADELLELAGPLVTQEWIPGDDTHLFTCNLYVSSQGIPILTFVTRKLRQWPPRLGTGSLGESVRDEDVRDLAIATIAPLTFFGLAYVEIKRDPRDGRDVIIEANVCRPTGRSATAEAGGVELLQTMYLDAIGAPVPSGSEQTDEPIKWMHVGRDLRAAWYQLRRRQLTPRQWVRSLQGRRVYADLDRADLGPFVGSVRRGLRRALRVPCRSRAGAT